MAVDDEKNGKRRVSGVGGRWENLSPELLAEVCGRLTADETSRTVPFVCGGWREVVMGPYCWGAVDLEQWCRRVNRTDVIDAAVRTLVRRGRGSLQRLCAYKLGNSAFCYVACCGRCLKVLHMPVSDVTDQIVEKHAASLVTLMELDISYCLKITSRGIEAIGKHCRHLINLRRNMPPPEIDFGPTQDAAPRPNDEEALAIAKTMPGLQNLELAYGLLGDIGLDAIVSNCRSLRMLDIRGCWCVEMAGDIEDRCLGILTFVGPWDDDYADASLSSEDEHGDCDGLVDVDASDTSDEDD